MANEILIPERNFAGNPLMVSIYVGIAHIASYAIWGLENEEENLIFSGVAYSLTDYAEIDISSVVCDVTTSSIFKYRISILNDDGNALFTSFFWVYPGGLSKLYLRNMNNGLDSFFNSKLKNNEANFFLTTRTFGSYIFIPETELMPLGYYAKGLKFSVKSFQNSITLATYDHLSDTEESLVFLDLKQLQDSCLLSSEMWPTEFRLHSDLGWICTIVITLSQPSLWAIKFKNSFGVFEKISIPGTAVFSPSFTEGSLYQIFDSSIKSFKKKASRKTISSKIQFSVTDFSASERDFLIDMLLSDSTYLIKNGVEYECIVECTSDVFKTDDSSVASIDLSVMLIDTDMHYSSLSDDDLNVLTVNGDELTIDSKNIVIN